MTKTLDRLRTNWAVAAMGGLIVFGSFVRLRQYAVNRSLWVDEAALALNIVNRSLSELASPLDYWQGAPPAFLWVTKLATMIGHESEPWLRLIPLLVSLTALVAFALVARRYLGQQATVLALALLVLSDRLIYYASEVKQYSLDVLATILILGLYIAFRARTLTPVNTVVLAAVGGGLVWFSQPAIFVLAGVGLTWLIEAWRAGDRRRIAYLVVVGLCWVGSFALVAWLSFGRLAGNEQLAQFWAASGFPPAVSTGLDLPGWFLQKYMELFSRPVGLALVGLGALTGTVGIVSFYQRDRLLLASLVLPILMAMLASLFRIYPFADRLILFTAPMVAILVAEGTDLLVRNLDSVQPRLGLVLVILMLYAPVTQAMRSAIVPNYGEEMRPVLTHIEKNWQPGDRIYVYYGSTLPFEYYRERFGFKADDYQIGVESRTDWAPYFNEMDELSETSGRVWMLFSHVYHESGASEESLLVNYLNHRGTIHNDVFRAPGAAVYLYEFTN